MYELAQAPPVLKFHLPGYFGKQGIITSYPDIQAGFEFCAPLPHENSSAVHQLACKTLYSKPLGMAVSSIPGAADSFFVCHD